MFAPDVPDLVGLCEVGARLLGLEVGTRVWGAGLFSDEWSGNPSVGQTGQMVLFRNSTLSRTRELAVSHRGFGSRRTSWLAAELQADRRAPFWFIVNHWKSNMGGGPWDGDLSRHRMAYELGDFYQQKVAKGSWGTIMVGDFNCEPGDLPFRGLAVPNQPPSRLRQTREHRALLGSHRGTPAFYSPMCRLMAEPVAWDHRLDRGAGPQATQLGTHLPQGRVSGWFMWDQLLVNRPMLWGGSMSLRESSVVVQSPVGKCSDHCAIGAVFD